jgi:DnaJ family protein A protein 2
MPDFYEILGVDKNASQDDLKSSYRKLVIKHHPDKGGDEEKFKMIQKAYEVLSDDGRRQMYDMTGNENDEAGGNGGFPGGGVPFDIGSLFGNMFGGGMPFGGMGIPGMSGMHGMPGMPHMKGKRKGEKAPNKTHEIPLSLYDFYHGKTIHVNFDKQIFCEQCRGDGSETKKRCGECRGQGMVNKLMQVGPGMMMQSSGPCSTCAGSGEILGPSCKLCNGRKMKNIKTSLELKIEPGSEPGKRIIFESECSDTPEYEKAGDVHFILQEAENKDGWERKGDDLWNNVEIRLGESLIGCKKVLKGHPAYPDGMEIHIPSGVNNGDCVYYEGEGIMKRGHTTIRVSVVVQKAELDVLTVNRQALQSMFSVELDTGGISGKILG